MGAPASTVLRLFLDLCPSFRRSGGAHFESTAEIAEIAEMAPALSTFSAVSAVQYR